MVTTRFQVLPQQSFVRSKLQHTQPRPALRTRDPWFHPTVLSILLWQQELAELSTQYNLHHQAPVHKAALHHPYQCPKTNATPFRHPPEREYRWAYEHRVAMDFSRPGRPTDNPFIESFNGSFRDECLNIHWFLSLDDAREKIENWRVDYEMPTRVQPFQAALSPWKHPTWTVCPAGRRLFVRSFSIP
jgi:hypothetical protein